MPFEKNTEVRMLGTNKNLSWKKTTNGMEIKIPKKLKNTSNYVWVLKILKK
jgi:hypothetical protein